VGLILYRKIQPETAGAGKFRGGAAVETVIAPHGASGNLLVTHYSQGHDHPTSKGVAGGYPSSVQGGAILRKAQLPSGDIPRSVDEITYESLEIVPAKGIAHMNEGDLFLSFCTGGSGFGDPLERTLDLVARDVERMAVAPELAARAYGVVVYDAGTVDAAATEKLRLQVRDESLQEAIVTGTKDRREAPGLAKRLLSIGEAVDVLEAPGGTVCACSKCGHVYGPGDADPKMGASYRHRRLEDISRLNRFAASAEEFVLREFFCPECALLIKSDVVRPEWAVEPDAELDLSSLVARPQREAA